MTPNPKKIRLKLSPKEYHDLKIEIYNEQLESCFYCYKWLPMDEFQLHHRLSRGAGGGDDRDNLQGLCFECHRKIHDGRQCQILA